MVKDKVDILWCKIVMNLVKIMRWDVKMLMVGRCCKKPQTNPPHTMSGKYIHKMIDLTYRLRCLVSLK